MKVVVNVTDLSAREQELLGHVAAGCSYKCAGRKMGITINTLESYMKTIKKKTGMSRKELIDWYTFNAPNQSC